MATARYIATERVGDVLILTPQSDLGEGHWLDIGGEPGAVLRMLEDTSLRGVVLDLSHADYLGSESLGWLLRIQSRVKPRGGRVLLCHLSPHAQEVLSVTSLDRILGVAPTRADALAELQAGK